MNKASKNTILLADDHTVLREGLASIINAFGNWSVIAEAGNGLEVMDRFEKGTIPDVVLLDLNMPNMDGYATASWLQANYPEVKILVLTMFDSEIALIRLLKIGVRGFLKKDIYPNELKNALQSVAEDGYYYSNNTTGKLANFFQKAESKNTSIDKSLPTEKEIEFLKLVCTEMTYKEIAHKMGLTPRSIDSFRDTLFEKLDVTSRVGLAIYCVKNGIVTF